MTKTELKKAWEDYQRLSEQIRKLSYNSLVRETSEQQEARIKHLLEPENYVEYFDYYFGINSGLDFADAPSSWFHGESYLKVFNNPMIKQQRRWFRGAAKSIHTIVGNTTALKQNKKVKYGVIIGKTEDHAKGLLSNLQLQLESNERYIKDFGKQMQYGNWAEGAFETMDKSFFKALGLNQPFRGLNHNFRRPDLAIIDDVEDRKQAKNIELTKENVQKLTGDLGKAGQRGCFRQIMNNNFIVKKGIVQGYAEKNKKSPNLDIMTINLCDKEFNPTWNERYTKQECIEIVNDSDYYTSQREDFNNPVEEGKRFKESWIRFKKSHGNKIWSQLIEFWDLSFTKEGDHKGGAIIGFENGRAHVLRLFNRQCDKTDGMNMHFTWRKEFSAKGMAINSFYDATASQKSVYEPLWFVAAEQNNSTGIPLDDHAAGDKHDRIIATLTSVFRYGLLTFDDSLRETKDMDKTIEHIVAFEKGCTTPDDILDSLESCVRKGRALFGYSTNENSRTNNKAIIKKRKRGGH